MADDKPHKPTPRRLEEARKKGEVIKSAMFTGGCVMVVASGTLILFLSVFWRKNEMLLEWLLTQGFTDLPQAVWESVKLLTVFLLVPLGLAATVGILVEVLQVGVRFEFGTLSPKFSRFDLAQGLKRSIGGLKKTWFEVAKLLLLGALLLWLPWQFLELLPGLVVSPVSSSLIAFRTGMLQLLGGIAAALFVVSGVEYALNRRDFYRRNSMTDQELRREHKDDEGDPHMNAMRRSLREEALLADLTERVRRSKVIIVQRSAA